MFTIKIFPLGPLEVNSNIIHNGSEAILIDVGGDPTPILRYLATENITLQAIYLTHIHFDHIWGLSALAKAVSVPIYVHDKDLYLLESSVLRPENYGLPKLTVDYEFTTIAEGSSTLLGENMEILLCPGHTLGSLCYYLPSIKAVFTGDVLFYNTIGRTDLPGGDYATIVQSITQKLFTLPNDTMVYPGHGKPTTIGREKEHNPAIEELE